MAEIAEVVQPTETNQEQQPSIQELAAFAFNKPLQEQQQAAGTGLSATTATEAAAATPTETQQQAATPDYSAFIKENFGVDNLEAAKTEWQTLQQLKANPPQAEPFKFENEESKKFAEAVSKGDRKTVLQILGTQEKIESLSASEVSDDNAEAILKLAMQIKHKEQNLSDKEIEYKYNKEFGIPKEPIQGNDELDEDFNERKSQWQEKVSDIKMNRSIEAKLAKTELEAAKAKIVLPDIQQLTPDKEYEAYKASNASAAESYDKVIAPAIKALKESDVPLSFSVNDVNNKMQFDVTIVPDAADFESARQDSLTLDVMKTCYDKDGKFLPQNLQKIILLANNFDKYGQAIARQAVNAERKRVIEQETIGGGGQRNFQTQVEPTELDALKAFAFQKTG